jgi:hypothetical protein
LFVLSCSSIWLQRRWLTFILCDGFGHLVIEKVGKLDLRCMFVFTFLGLALVGPVLHFWYIIILLSCSFYFCVICILSYACHCLKQYIHFISGSLLRMTISEFAFSFCLCPMLYFIFCLTLNFIFRYLSLSKLVTIRGAPVVVAHLCLDQVWICNFFLLECVCML